MPIYTSFTEFQSRLYESNDDMTEDHDGESVEDGKLKQMIVDLDAILEERHGQEYRLIMDYLESFATDLIEILDASDMPSSQQQEMKGIVEMAMRKAVSHTHNDPAVGAEEAEGRGSSEEDVARPGTSLESDEDMPE